MIRGVNSKGKMGETQRLFRRDRHERDENSLTKKKKKSTWNTYVLSICTGLVGNIKREEGSDIISLILGFRFHLFFIFYFYFLLYLLKDGASPFSPLSIYSFTLFHLMSFSMFPSCLIESPFPSCRNKCYDLHFSFALFPFSPLFIISSLD